MSAVAAEPRAQGAPPDDAPFLGRRERRTVAALAEVLFPPAEGAMLTPGRESCAVREAAG